MFLLNRFVSISEATVVIPRAILRIVDAIPRQGPDWFAVPDDAGHVLLPHPPADQDQTPRQGRA